MLIKRKIGKTIMYSVMMVIPFCFSTVFANGGTGKGDGDGTFGYQSSDESKKVRICMGYINDVNAAPNNGTVRALGSCLMEVRETYKHRPPYMRNVSTCGMLDLAAAESCAGRWGFLGIDHQNCKSEFTDKVGRREGWFANFGYCNKSCPAVNPPVIDAYPIDLPPCGLTTLPWGVTLIP